MTYRNSLGTFAFVGWLAAGGVLMPLMGCNDDPCAELAEICQRCPTTDLGPVAKESCERAVETADDHTCEEKVDQKSFAAFGCR